MSCSTHVLTLVKIEEVRTVIGTRLDGSYLILTVMTTTKGNGLRRFLSTRVVKKFSDSLRLSSEIVGKLTPVSYRYLLLFVF